MSETIVFLDPLSPERIERLRTLLPSGFAIDTTASRESTDQIAGIERADYAVTGDVPVDGAMMRAGAARRLKAVHKWGVGYDNIDVEGARVLNVRVLRTTGSNALAVAETTVALMLAVQRSVVGGHLGMLDGQWLKGTLGPHTFLLSGKTVGLIGLGFIGKNVARLLRSFGCRVLYVKQTPLSPNEERELGAESASLETILEEADLVSMHCSLTPATRNLIDRDALAAMKAGAALINTARGGIVDEAALADAVKSGHLGGAAVDVFEQEPATPDNRLVGLPGVIVTPHIASQAADNFSKTVSRMFENLRCVSMGKPVPELDVVA